MPIHRLNEEATEQGIISDLTCDSDGKIDQFIDINDVKHVLPLHNLKDGEPYILGIFLTGAYQEIMGDYHNLFGATHAVHLHVNGDGYKVEHVIEGDSMAEVMNSVEYEKAHVIEAVRRATEHSLLEKQMTIEESHLLLKHYTESLMRYTYLNSRKKNFTSNE
jgi:arginine decarboxylase